MKRTYKFRLYPTPPQQTTLTQWLITCRLLYNNALAERKEAWHTHQHAVSYYEQATHLKVAKQTNPCLKAVHSQVLQDVLRRLDKTFANFFRRLKRGERPGYPRFKGKYRYDSFSYPQSGFALDYHHKKLGSRKSEVSPLNSIVLSSLKVSSRPVPSNAMSTTGMPVFR